MQISILLLFPPENGTEMFLFLATYFMFLFDVSKFMVVVTSDQARLVILFRNHSAIQLRSAEKNTWVSIKEIRNNENGHSYD